MDDDFYAGWYGAKLWAMLPAIYRTLDSPDNGITPGPLQEFCNRLGVQAAVLRRSIDRLWDNQSIETCDDWVIPYIGQLLATRIVACLPPRAQRLDVAKTIYYRRRAGTLGLIEELTTDIAGHDARAVEFFRRLGRTRHNFDPAIGLTPNLSLYPTPAALLNSTPPRGVIEGLCGPYSRTPAGGFADLRNNYAASNTGTAFDEYAYTADFRAGRQSTGWYSISHLGMFIWWLYAFPVTNGTPAQNPDCPLQFSFDPIGREVPLFAPSQRAQEDFADNWVAPNEWQLAAPVRETLWKLLPPALYPNAFSVAVGEGAAPPILDASQFEILPESGRFRFLGAGPAARVSVVYHFGFSSGIGAGAGPSNAGFPAALATPANTVRIGGGTGLATALQNLSSNATIQLEDSFTYAEALGDAGGITTVPGNLALIAATGTRPVLRLQNQPAAHWTLKAPAVQEYDLVIQGLWLQGADLIIDGAWNNVTLQLCTLDPGSADPGHPSQFLSGIDGHALVPTHLVITGQIATLTLNSCITGPILTQGEGAVATLMINNSIVQATSHEPAISAATGLAQLSRTTVLGTASLHELSASECIFDAEVTVQNAQEGCVRYSTIAQGSNLHAPFRCATVPPRSDIFDSRAFGQPNYARVSAGADLAVLPAKHVEPPPSVLTGAAGGGQPGAFCAEQQALLALGLAAKLEEYAPAGLIPVWVDAEMNLPINEATQ
jgi:hypothetical protein